VSALAWVAIAAALGLFLAFWRPLAIALELRRQRFRQATAWVIDIADVPVELQEYLRAAAAPLLEHGFVDSGWIRAQAADTAQLEATTSLLLHNHAYGTVASICASPVGWGSQVEFEARFSSGLRLESAHGESAVRLPAVQVELVDTSSPDPLVLWERFRVRVEELRQQDSLQPLQSVEQEVREALVEIARANDAALRLGHVEPSSEQGTLRWSWRGALAQAWRLTKRTKALQAFRVARAEFDTLEQPLEQQMIACRAALHAVRQPRGVRPASILLVGSAFPLLWLAPSALAGLLVACLCHDLGHYLTTRALGVRDRSTLLTVAMRTPNFSVPPHASTHQRLQVLLVGPLLGLAIAPLVAASLPSLRSDDVVVFLAVVFALNLLNIVALPGLDGWHIVQLLSYGRSPRFGLALRLASLGVLAAFGTFSPGGLAALALVPLVGMLVDRRAAPLIRTLRSRGPIPEDDDERLRWVLCELMAMGTVRREWRCGTAVLLAERLRVTPPGRTQTFMGIAAYLALVALAVLPLTQLRTLRRLVSRGTDATAPLACHETQRLAQELSAGSPTFFSFRCALDGPQRAAAVEDELKSFSRLPSSGCLRAPWHAMALAIDEREQQDRARRTVVLLATEAERRFRHLYQPPSGIAPGTPGQPTPAEEAAMGVASRKVDSELDAMVHARRVDPSFDVATADLYLHMRRAMRDEDGRPQTLDPLLQRLGLGATPCDQAHENDATAAFASDETLRVVGTRHQPADLVALANYLCDHGCKLRYSLRPRPRRNKNDEAE